MDRDAAYAEELRGAASHADAIEQATLAERRALDERAFESDTFYWPIVCAQMREGNL